MTNEMCRINYDFKSMQGIFERDAPLNDFSRSRMEQVRYFLRSKETYNCVPGCNNCCYGSILMSYTEFNYIMLCLQLNWSPGEIKDLWGERLGILQDESTLLCPFLREDAKQEHCSIYQARPLICRAFGTTAAPCQEEIEPPVLDEELFFLAYNLLRFSEGNFIALYFDQNWALFEAPFALWCLADESKESRMFLRDLIAGKKESFHAVLYDRRDDNFFVYKKGEKEILSAQTRHLLW